MDNEIEYMLEKMSKEEKMELASVLLADSKENEMENKRFFASGLTDEMEW